MKRLLLGLFALLGTATIGHTADLPRKGMPVQPIPDYYAPVGWQGAYIGLNGGWLRQGNDFALAGTDYLGGLAITKGIVPASAATGDSGVLMGVTLGYNFQFGNIVAGPEFDFDWSNIKKTSSVTNPVFGPFSVTTAAQQKLDWLSTFRARVGYLVMPTLLLYATGGGAAASVNSNWSATINGPFLGGTTVGFDETKTRVGWTVGGGVEYAFANRWTVKAEYKYVDLGSIDTAASTNVLHTTASFAGHQDYKLQTAVAGVNYRF